jgi:hypothetical protein
MAGATGDKVTGRFVTGAEEAGAKVTGDEVGVSVAGEGHEYLFWQT